VADGEFLGADEDVLDEGAQDALAVLGGGGGRVGAEPGEEAFEVAGLWGFITRPLVFDLRFMRLARIR
jgi:hypothetical protein